MITTNLTSLTPQTRSATWERDTWQGGTAGKAADYPAKLARCQWLDNKIGEIKTFWANVDSEVSGLETKIYNLKNEISTLANEDYNINYKMKDLNYKLNEAKKAHYDADREQRELYSRSPEEKAADPYHQWKYYDANNRRTAAAAEVSRIEDELRTLNYRKQEIGNQTTWKNQEISQVQYQIQSKKNDKQYYNYEYQQYSTELRQVAYEIGYSPYYS